MQVPRGFAGKALDYWFSRRGQYILDTLDDIGSYWASTMMNFMLRTMFVSSLLSPFSRATLRLTAELFILSSRQTAQSSPSPSDPNGTSPLTRTPTPPSGPSRTSWFRFSRPDESVSPFVDPLLLLRHPGLILHPLTSFPSASVPMISSVSSFRPPWYFGFDARRGRPPRFRRRLDVARERMERDAPYSVRGGKMERLSR